MTVVSHIRNNSAYWENISKINGEFIPHFIEFQQVFFITDLNLVKK